MYPHIDFFGIVDIPLYGPIFIFAFFLSIIMARKWAYLYNVDKLDAMCAAFYAGIGLLIGAKVMYLITKLPKIIMNWDSYWKFLTHDFIGAAGYALGGLVFYGGLIGGFLGILRYCKHFKVPMMNLIDLYTPFIPFVHGFGRIGCFMAGCCYGIEYHGFGAVQFPYNDLVPELCEVPRFPVQLLEACLNFIMSGILFYLMKKKKMKPGQMLGIYLLYYTVARYLLEMLRGDLIRGKVGVLSTSQIISIILIPIALFLLFRKTKKKEPVENKTMENEN